MPEPRNVNGNPSAGELHERIFLKAPVIVARVLGEVYAVHAGKMPRPLDAPIVLIVASRDDVDAA